jgi:hypothetical protein
MNELQLAQQVAQSLKTDKMAEIFLNASPEMMTDIAMAYAASEVKKFESFVCEYLAKKECREQFQSLVLNIAV